MNIQTFAYSTIISPKKSMNRKNSNFCIFIYEQITTTQLTTHLN